MAKCWKCKRTEHETQFYKNQSLCTPCKKKYDIAHKDQLQEYRRNYYLRNMQRFKDRRRKWYYNNLERARANSREWGRKHGYKVYWKSALRRHHITEAQYLALLQKQNYRCAICRTKAVVRKYGPPRLYIDHCHKKQKVRGLLCSSCNAALGSFKESRKALLAALRYLKKQKK